MSAPLVAVAGTGAFAGALVRALARHPHPLRLHVLSRDADRARNLADVARDHAHLAGAGVVCGADSLDPHDPQQARRLLAALRPEVLVVAGSEQSPAEGRSAPSAWTDLLAQCGFGLTLPLQSAVVARLTAACAAGSPDTTVVNACFPDAVNPLLHAAGLPVACGLGNVATLASALSARLGLANPLRLHLLAHHAHLHTPLQPEDDARGWLDGAPLDGLRSHLTPVRSRDEVQTAWGRTGQGWWGYQLHGLRPDAVTFAKGIAGGLPMGGLVAERALLDSLPGKSISTFGGNPLSCTAALITLDVIRDRDLLRNADEIGALLLARLRTLQEREPHLAAARGHGLMLAVDLIEPGSGEAAPGTAREFVSACRDLGLLIGLGGPHGNCLRIAPPLTVTAEEARKAAAVLEEAAATTRPAG